MNKIHFKWKYGWLVFVIAVVCACSDQNELAQIANKNEEQNNTRTAELKTKTIELQAIGTLESELTAAMGGEDVGTLEKLILSGPFSVADLNFIRNSLTGLISLDMRNALICESSVYFFSPYVGTVFLEKNTVCNGMFSDLGLKEIVLPSTAIYIDGYAFYNCHSLSSVILPNDLEEINYEAFRNCNSLKAISIPDKVKYIGYNAFGYCSALTSVEFTSTSKLDSIADNAFYDTNLKSIIIPEQVTTIGNSAFSFCDSLATVTLSSNLEYIGDEAFKGCYMLTSIVIPDKVKKINPFLFYDCTSLASITLPSGLESIGGYAFSRCAFTSVDLPSTLKTLSGCSFEYCSSLASITIPSGVESIGGHTFWDCDALKELTIPETVTNVEDGFANAADGIQAIYWKAPVDVPYNHSTSNCFLYIETDQAITADECWKNVIVNGVAQSAITIEERNNEFTCYKEFTAPEVVYTRYFGDETVPGGSSGWQTIVLPFTPDSIGHESKGEIAPFNSDKEGTKSFWLRELTADGFVDVTTIEPDKAYLIAMPNHSDYLDDYRLNGTITFTAKNVTIKKTPDTLQPSVGPDFDFHPTYKFVKQALYVYALQSLHDYYDNMWYGKNFFIRSSGGVYPFNAYVTAPGGGRSSRSTYDIDTRSKETRAKYSPNNTGIPQIGDM